MPPSTLLDVFSQHIKKPASNSDKSAEEIIKERRSRDLVIGLCGAIGSGVKTLKNALYSELRNQKYEPVHIRMSDLIARQFSDSDSVADALGFDRYHSLQERGDKLRSSNGGSFIAELVINEIKVKRTELLGKNKNNKKRMVFIIDQLKHPDEARLLQTIYRNSFYLVGFLRTLEERAKNLRDEQISENDVKRLIDRDRKSGDKYGQHVESTIRMSDYFIRNMGREDHLKKNVQRLIRLIHGVGNETPTRDEIGIFSAYSAAYRSACLSRQVGAAIMDEEGSILSTGCNDVPKYGGGLYSAESGHNDHRCFTDQRACSNDRLKEELRAEIENVLKSHGIESHTDISNQVMKETGVKSLIEYSRAIHAEMDAILALARNNSVSTVGKTLYCTTYPCHICARHIVTSGIKRVVYIEPYEKSLAIKLHGDAIHQFDDSNEQPPRNKVIFENFEGVSPSRYGSLFRLSRERKNGRTGELIVYTVETSEHIDPIYMDGYEDYETKVIQSLQDRGLLKPPHISSVE